MATIDSGTLKLYRNTTPYGDYDTAIAYAKTISGLADGQPCLVRYNDNGKSMAILVIGGVAGNAIIDFGEVGKLKEEIAKIEQQPTVGSASLTIKQNGVTKEVFDGLENKEVDIIVPTKVSELANDESFVKSTELGNYATTEFVSSNYQPKGEYLTSQDLNGYVESSDIADMATKTWVNGEGFLKEHQSLDGYAKLTDIPDVTKYFDGVDYVKDRKEIQFKNNGSVLATIDTTDFIKDGMVESVSLTDGSNANIGKKVLKITFNTDAGKEPIELPIESIFNVNNYYTKDEADSKFASQGNTFSKEEAEGKFATKDDLSAKADKGESYTKAEADAKFTTADSLGNYVAKGDLKELRITIDGETEVYNTTETVRVNIDKAISTKVSESVTSGPIQSAIEAAKSAVTKTLTVQKNGSSVGTYNGTNDTTINIELNDYYTKTEVDREIKDSVNDATKTLTIQRNSSTVGTYNGKSDAFVNIEVPTKITDLEGGTGLATETWVQGKIDSVDVTEQLKDYYKKSETYNKSEVDDKLKNVDLSNYYTKSETYTQKEVDDKLKDIDVTSQLGDYYKKSETYSQTEIDKKLSEIDVTSQLGDYAKTADVTKTLTIQRNGVSVGTYNGTADATINITVQDGAAGGDGEPGAPGKDGADGKTWKPSVSDSGELSWTISEDTTPPQTVNIKGQDGKDGTNGTNGTDGKTWYPSVAVNGDLTWTESETSVAPAKVNIMGPQGPAGKDGTGITLKSSKEECTQIGDAYIDEAGNIQIKNGSGADDFKNGGQVKGPKGDDGAAAGFGTPTYDNSEANGIGEAQVEVTATGEDTAKVFNFKFINLKGETGAQGAKGETWKPTVDDDGNLSWEIDNTATKPEDKNIRGPQGPQGPKGDDGTGISVKSSQGECVETGDAYIDAQGHIQIFNKETSDFTDGGEIKGPKGDTWKPTVDAAGNLTWELDSTGSAPSPQNIKGVKGDTPTLKLISGTDIASTGTPNITTAVTGNEYSITFHQLKGAPGADGTKITTVTATADGTSKTTPTVAVTTGGTATEMTLNFAFSGLKGQDGENGSNATVSLSSDLQSLLKYSGGVLDYADNPVIDCGTF